MKNEGDKLEHNKKKINGISHILLLLVFYAAGVLRIYWSGVWRFPVSGHIFYWDDWNFLIICVL